MTRDVEHLVCVCVCFYLYPIFENCMFIISLIEIPSELLLDAKNR